MRLYKFVVLFLVGIVLSQASVASPAWYIGKVKRIALTGSDGSFVITFSNSDLDDCMDKYAYFSGTKLGEGRLKAAYSMALTSLTARVDMGVVIDKAVNGAGGQCYATGMTADLRSS